ncbi:molybdenum ABC transporter ATP-binding protein [Chitiniphilus purpureus]|uniref:Molybdenum ABC transporter ATP-binding protein n=1 Tax=Chitiniphilus purpureus TaxID=2981137 RepID=A0ABY6DVH4_9NEIS|nr:molybdenum ABC transporter ATP-binding protein [Chitiniphilus sp. CD1]UXY15853.1 molybdenum ABC transporter ATP-binding protein [Chitiniphilus sp. CD1]
MSIAACFRLARAGFTLDVDLALPGRGVIGIAGPSGAGKSTVLRLIAGLEQAEAGRLQVNGSRWHDGATVLPAHARPVGMVFQDARLFPHLSVRQNVAYGWQRIHPAARRVTLAQAIEAFDLGPLCERDVARLSGGERQRVALARAVAVSPQLMLLDEPLAALDATRKDEILPYLARLARDFALPVLYVSHAPDELAQLADHLVWLQDGRVRACAPAMQLFADPDSPFNQREDCAAVIPARIALHDGRDQLSQAVFDGGALWLAGLRHPPGAAVRLRIAARDVSLARGTPTHSSILNILPATVTALRPHGPWCLVALAVGAATLFARVSHRSVRELALGEGVSVYAQVKAAAMS